MNFIPYNEANAQMFEERLANTAYRSTDQFIMLYNEGALNANNANVKGIAEQIMDQYKNLEIKNRFFVIKSDAEVALRESIDVLEMYAPVTILKRIANELAKTNYANDTRISFTESKPGVMFLTDSNGETIASSYNEKVFSAHDRLLKNLFLESILKSETLDEDGEVQTVWYFNLEDLVGLNEDFVLQVGEIISNALKNALKA